MMTWIQSLTMIEEDEDDEEMAYAQAQLLAKQMYHRYQ